MNEAGKGRVGEWGKKRRRTKDAERKTQDAGKKEWEKGRMGEWENFVLRVDRRLIFWKRRKAFVKL